MIVDCREEKTVVLIQPHCSFHLKGKPVLMTEHDAMGLLALCAYLRAKRFNVKIIHVPRALSLGHTIENIFGVIDQLNPLLFGISMNWLHMSQGAIEIAELLKKKFPAAPVVTGGSHASLFAGEIMAEYHDRFDGVVVGEGEETLHEAVERVQKREGLGGIPGLMINHDGELRYAPREVAVAVDMLPLYSYQHIWPEVPPKDPFRNLAALTTTRGGCTKNCNYCLESGTLGKSGRRKAVHYSTDRLLEQMELLVRERKPFIAIEDPISCHGDEFIMELMEKMLSSAIHLYHLSFFIEPNALSRQAYDMIEKAPAREIVLSFGMETGSEKVARNLNRTCRRSVVYDELEHVGRKKLFAMSWWMVGLPGETREDIDLTKSMIHETMKMGVYPQSVSPLILFPQTELARNHAQFGIRKLFNTFDDFRKFSVVPKNELGVYPELITHDSACQPLSDTVHYYREVKEFVVENTVMEEQKRKAALTPYVLFRKDEIF